jgi:hypothetical protein
MLAVRGLWSHHLPHFGVALYIFFTFAFWNARKGFNFSGFE